MRRRQRHLEVSTFPFLAVLLCTMGSLILLLMVLDRRAKIVAMRKAQDEIAQVQADRDRRLQMRLRQQAEDQHLVQERQAEWERRSQQLHAALAMQEEELQGQIKQTRDQAAAAEAKLQSEKTRAEQEKSQLQLAHLRYAGTQQAIKAQQDAVDKSNQQSAAAQRELRLQADNLARLEQTLANLKALRERQKSTYSLVPYLGRRGDNRKPVYVECANGAVVFHQDNVVLEGLQLNSENMRAEVNRCIARQREQSPLSSPSGAQPGQPPPRPYLLMLVRPDGIMTYYRVQQALAGMQVDFGYEFIERDWVMDFSGEGNDAAAQPWMTTVNLPTTVLVPGTPGARPSSPEGKFMTLPGGGAIGGTPPGIAGPPTTTRTGGGGGTAAGGGGFGSGNSDGGSPFARGGIPGPPPTLGSQRQTSGSGPGGFPWQPPGFAGGGSGGPPGSAQMASGGDGLWRSNALPYGTGPGGSSVQSMPPGPPPTFPAYGIPGVTGGTGTANGQGGNAGGWTNGPGGGPPGAANGSSGAPVVWTKGPGGGPPGATNGSVGGPEGAANGPTGSQTGASNGQGGGQAGASSGQGGGQASAPNGQGGGQAGAPNGPNGSQAGTANGPGGAPAAGAPGQPGNGGSDGGGGGIGGGGGTGGGGGEGGGGGSGIGGLEAGPTLGRPTKDATNAVPQASLGRILANRDWLIYIECNADNVVVKQGNQVFSVDSLAAPTKGEHPLLQAVRQMIARRQATVRAGEPPYRPMLRFQVRSDGLRAYYLAYPMLDSLHVPMARENVLSK